MRGSPRCQTPDSWGRTHGDAERRPPGQIRSGEGAEELGKELAAAETAETEAVARRMVAKAHVDAAAEGTGGASELEGSDHVEEEEAEEDEDAAAAAGAAGATASAAKGTGGMVQTGKGMGLSGGGGETLAKF